MRIGVDLGGTKLEAVALDDSGTELAKQRVATPRGDYEGTLDAIAELVSELEQQTGQSGTVGIGMPGSFSTVTGLIRNANSTWLIGKPFDRDLQARMGREVRFANDANCLAVSEAVDGAGAGATVVFAIILGTGVGGGVALHGKVHNGHNAIGGEWGHNPLGWMAPEEYPGPECYCGKRGCIETFVSGTGFEQDFLRTTGERVRGPEIVARAESGRVRPRWWHVQPAPALRSAPPADPAVDPWPGVHHAHPPRQARGFLRSARSGVVVVNTDKPLAKKPR